MNYTLFGCWKANDKFSPRLEVKADGECTGQVLEKVCAQEEKGVVVREFTRKIGLVAKTIDPEGIKRGRWC